MTKEEWTANVKAMKLFQAAVAKHGPQPGYLASIDAIEAELVAFLGRWGL